MLELSGLDLIDLNRYPIDVPDSPAGRDLFALCHRNLREKALCLLPGFIKPAVLDMMIDEVTPLLLDAFCYDDQLSIGYDGLKDGLRDDSFPAGHPRRLKFPDRYQRLANHQIPNDALLRKLYLCEPLTEFVRRVFDAKTLYRMQCPHFALTVKIEAEGGTDSWHYDVNDGVVSLLLQQAASGGEFEYAPYIRTETDECYEDVSRMLADPDRLAERPALEPGTFVLFNGKLSLHRVREVGVTRHPRIVALLSYDQRPDCVPGQALVDYLKTLPHARELEQTTS